MDHPNRVGITAPSGDSTTRLATTAFVTGAIGALSSFAASSNVVNSIGGVSGVITLGTGLSISGSTLSATGTTPSGALVSIVYYSSSQTITIPSSATKAFVRMWGASGATGGTAVGNTLAQGGTGAAGYLEKYLTGLTSGNTVVYAQGVAGAAGGSSGSSGTAGTASVLSSGTQTIPTLTANGSNGAAGSLGGNVSGPGSSGATATGGDLNITGQDGQNGFDASGTGAGPFLAGQGGGSLFAPGVTGKVIGVAATAGTSGRPGGLIIAWFT